MRTTLAALLLVVAASPAFAQTPSSETPAQRAPASAASTQGGPDESAGRWTAQLSVLNMFDGNINHDPAPIRSYGFVPGASFGYESSAEPRLVAGYDIAANQFTGTNEWDRISHGLHAVVNARLGRKWRFEGGGDATWKGSSDDRELSNEYGVSGRASYRLLATTRLIAIGTLRYKDYPDDPETSGPAPYVGGKIDQRLPGARRLVFGYKYEERRSRLERNQYWRNGYSVEFTTPFLRREGRLTVGAVVKTQTYRRLIKVGSQREPRHDLRSSIDVGYEYPLANRVLVQWLGGFEARRSNDPDKRFVAPVFGMNVAYRWRE
jgi:hypothetical protein